MIPWISQRVYYAKNPFYTDWYFVSQDGEGNVVEGQGRGYGSGSGKGNSPTSESVYHYGYGCGSDTLDCGGDGYGSGRCAQSEKKMVKAIPEVWRTADRCFYTFVEV